MVLMFKILTGKLPDLRAEAEFASFPQLVEILERCWNADPLLRITMLDALRAIRPEPQPASEVVEV